MRKCIAQRVVNDAMTIDGVTIELFAASYEAGEPEDVANRCVLESNDQIAVV